MAYRSKKVASNAKPQKEYTCRDCIKAYLMQSAPANPVVARCSRNGVREVASMNACKTFYAHGEKWVTTNPVIHPMVSAMEEGGVFDDHS